MTWFKDLVFFSITNAFTIMKVMVTWLNTGDGMKVQNLTQIALFEFTVKRMIFFAVFVIPLIIVKDGAVLDSL